MTGIVRWGILGTSLVSRRFAASLKLLGGTRIVAVASRRTSSAREFARDFGADRAHETVEDLVRNSDVDVVYVATPTGLHARQTLLCLREGKAVLCEKPLACSADEAESVVATARRREQFLMEGMWMRFVPLMVELRARVRAGAIGALHMLEADLAFPVPFREEDHRFDPRSGGGALLDLGVYPVSLALDLLGRPEAVDARIVQAPNGTDGQAAVTLSYPGAQAVLTCGFHGRGRNDAVLIGERGRFHVHEPLYCPEAMTFTTWPASGAPAHSARRGVLLERLPRVAGVYRRFLPGLRTMLGRDRRVRRRFGGFGYQFEAAEVVRCLRGGETESPIMPLDETVAVLQVLDVAREKAAS